MGLTQVDLDMVKTKVKTQLELSLKKLGLASMTER